MNWASSIQGRISDSVRKLGAKRWPSDEVRFWQLGVYLDEQETLNALEDVRMRRGSTPAAHVALLMHLLRTSLPSVRANRLWPDVAALIFDSTDTGVAYRNTCAQYFRGCLRETFGKRLESDSGHHKYVELLLDEAGVGYDRARIIQDFMLDLVRAPIGLSAVHQQVVESIVAHVRDYLVKEKRKDVDVLESVLIRAGTALVNVKMALLTRCNPAVVSAWTWLELSEFAEGVVGEKLERVIPEARSVFEALLPSLSSVISFSQAFELARQTETQITFPPTHDAAARPRAVEEVPFGTVKIRHKAIAKAAETVDANGFSAAALLEMEREKWHVRKRGRLAAIVRDKPFWVERNDGTRERSRPIFDDDDDPQGFGWSGLTFNGDGLCARAVRGAPEVLVLQRARTIVPIVAWKWSGENYCFRIGDLVYYDMESAGLANIMAGGEVLFSGQVVRGNGVLKNTNSGFRPVSDREAFDGFHMELTAFDELLVREVIRLPREPFAIINERLYSLEDIGRRPDGFGSLDRLILVGPTELGPPESSAGSFSKMASLRVRSGRLAYEWVFPQQEGFPQFRWAGRIWGSRGQIGRLFIEGSRTVKVGDCTVQGTGSIWPVLLDRPQQLLFRVTGVASGQSASLILQAGMISIRCPAPVSEAANIERLLDSLPAGARGQLGALATLHLEVDGEAADIGHGIFFIPATIDAESVGPDDRPRLLIRYGSGTTISVEALEPLEGAESTAVATLTFPAYDQLAAGSGVTFAWTPEKFRISLRADREIRPGESLTLHRLQSMHAELSGRLEAWTLTIREEADSTRAVTITMGDQSDLARAIRNAVQAFVCEHSENVSAVVLEARYRDRMVAMWPVSHASTDMTISASVRVGGQSVDVDTDLRWLGIPGRLISLRIRRGGAVLAEKHGISGTGAQGRFDLHGAATLIVPNVLLAPEIVPERVQVEAILDGQSTWTYPVKLPEVRLLPEQIPDEIRRLLGGPHAGVTAAIVCRRVVVLFHEYLVVKGKGPLDGGKVAHKMELILRDADCLGSASACLRALVQLRNNSGLPTLRPATSTECSPFGLVVNTVLVEIVEREARIGTMNPLDLDLLSRAVATQNECAGGSSGPFTELLARCRQIV